MPAAGRAVPALLRRRHLCRRSARRARPDRRLRVLRPAVLDLHRPDRVDPSSSFVLVAVPLFLLMGEILLRAGLSERLYSRAERLARPAAGRAAAHQHRGLGRVLGDLRLLRRDRRHHGLGRAAVLPGHALRPNDGARLARRRRRARQPHPARHHLHHLRADHRDLGRRALSRRGRPEHPGGRAVRRW